MKKVFFVIISSLFFVQVSYAMEYLPQKLRIFEKPAENASLIEQKPLVQNDFRCVNGYVKDGEECRSCRSNDDCKNYYPNSAGMCSVNGLCRCSTEGSDDVCSVGWLCNQNSLTCNPCKSDADCKKFGESSQCVNGGCKVGGNMIVGYTSTDKFKGPGTGDLGTNKNPGKDPSGSNGGSSCGDGGSCGSNNGNQDKPSCPSPVFWNIAKGFANSPELGLNGKKTSLISLTGFGGTGLNLIDVANTNSDDLVLIAYETKETQPVAGITGHYLQLFSKKEKRLKGAPTKINDLIKSSTASATTQVPFKIKGLISANGYYFALIDTWRAGFDQYQKTISFANPLLIRIGVEHDPATDQWLKLDKSFGNETELTKSDYTKEKVQSGVVEIFDLFEKEMKGASHMTFPNFSDPRIDLSDLYFDGRSLVFFVREFNQHIYFVSVPYDGKGAGFILKRLRFPTTVVTKDVPEIAYYVPSVATWFLVDRKENPSIAYSVSYDGRYMSYYDLKKHNIRRALSFNNQVLQDQNAKEKERLYLTVALQPQGSDESIGNFQVAVNSSPLALFNFISFGNGLKKTPVKFTLGSNPMQLTTSYKITTGFFFPLFCYDEKMGIWMESDAKGTGFEIRLSAMDANDNVWMKEKQAYSNSIIAGASVNDLTYNISPFIVSLDEGKYGNGMFFKSDMVNEKGDHKEEILYYNFTLRAPKNLEQYL